MLMYTYTFLYHANYLENNRQKKFVAIKPYHERMYSVIILSNISNYRYPFTNDILN